MDNQLNETFLTCEASRNIDKIAIEKYGIPGIVLMENAARGCVDWLEELGIDGPILIAAGKGNNGGDGFAIARHLLVRGYQVSLSFFGDPNSLTGDAKTNFRILSKLSDCVLHVHQNLGRKEFDPELFQSLMKSFEPTLIVDSLLGTGTTGELRSPLPALLRAMNEFDAKKFAVDLPSGMHADSGQSLGEVFIADFTATFVAKKLGFQQLTAKQFLGEVKVLDIGLPDSCWK